MPCPRAFPLRSTPQLEDAYRALGHFQARLDSFALDGAGLLRLWIIEGAVMRVGEVHWQSSERDLALLETWSLKTGQPFTEAALQGEIDAVLASLADRGHALARLSIDSLAFTGDGAHPRITLWLTVDTGPLVTLGSVTVDGNKLTQGGLILRETPLTSGAGLPAGAHPAGRGDPEPSGVLQAPEGAGCPHRERRSLYPISRGRGEHPTALTACWDGCRPTRPESAAM